MLLAITVSHGLGFMSGDTRAEAGSVVGMGLCGTGLACPCCHMIVGRIGAVAASVVI